MAPQVGSAADLAVGDRGGRRPQHDDAEGEGGDRSRPDEDDDEHGEGGEQCQLPGADDGQREVRSPAGHAGDPADQQPGGDVDQLLDGGRKDARRQSRRHPPDHHRSGGGNGEQVGREGGERDAAEGADEQRRHPRLGGDRDCERHRQPLGERSGEEGDAGARADRQAEAERVHEQRIDEEQPGHGEGEEAKRGRVSTHRHGGEGDRRHRLGPDHGGFPPGQHPEEDEDGEAGEQPAAQAEQPQGGPGDGEDERHVLARHRHEVGEAGGAEVGHVERRLVAVVAQDEAGEEGARVVLEGGRTTDERAAKSVGDAAERVAAVERARVADADASGDVADGEAGTVLRWDRGDAPGDVHPFAGEPSAQRGGGFAAGPRLEAVAVVAHVGSEGAIGVHGIGDERDDGVDRPGRLGLEAVPRAGTEARRERGGGDAEERRTASDEGEGDAGEDEREWQGAAGEGARRRGEGEGHGPAVGHTRTLSLRSASLASPMPRTSRSSSTDRKRPCWAR